MQPGWLTQFFTPRTEEQQQDAAAGPEGLSCREVMKGGFATGVAVGMAAGAAAVPQRAEAQVFNNPLSNQWWPSPWGAQDQKGAHNRITPAKVREAGAEAAERGRARRGRRGAVPHRPRRALEEGQRRVQQGLPGARPHRGALARRQEGGRGRSGHVAGRGRPWRGPERPVRVPHAVAHDERHVHQREPGPGGLAADRVYEFAWSFNPLPLKGGTGAPGNSVAIA